MNDRVKYWIELSNYDFETAKAMLATGRYLYVGFMCHQTIEKILKAYFCSTQTIPAPYTHSLSYLAGKSGILEKMNDETRGFLDVLEPLNIEARYPSHKENLLKALNNAKCEEIISKTMDLQLWIKARL